VAWLRPRQLFHIQQDITPPARRLEQPAADMAQATLYGKTRLKFAIESAAKSSIFEPITG